jgi:hypothetical protein
MSAAPPLFPLSSERGLFLPKVQVDAAIDGPTLRRTLGKWCGLDLPVCLFPDPVSARDRIVKAALSAERSHVMVIGAEPPLAHEDTTNLLLAELAEVPRRIEACADRLAAVLIEPRGELAMLRAIVTATRAVGAALLVDESRTAGRLTNLTVTAELEIEPDALLLGPSLSEGLPFAAVFGLADRSAELPQATLAAVHRSLARLWREPVSDRLSERGMRLRERFAAAARRVGSSTRLLGPAALLTVTFRDEPECAGEELRSKWRRDLRVLGFEFRDDILLCAEDPTELDDAIASAFERALAQQRQHLVAVNARIESLPGRSDDRLRDLGATATFVHPTTGRARVARDHRGLSLVVDAGPLGPATSVGVVSRELCVGDHRIEVEVELEPWSCDGGEAVFALIATDAASARRLQVVVGRRDAHPGRFAAAGVDGRWGAEIELLGSRFTLAIERRLGGFRCFIATHEMGRRHWHDLGEFTPAPPFGTLAVGCRVVGRIVAQSLVARLVRFERTDVTKNTGTEDSCP